MKKSGKLPKILLLSGALLLMAVFTIGIYVVPKLQAGSPQTARQSDASRVPLSDVYVDVTYATPEFVKRVKLEPYLKGYEGRAQPFLFGLNTHVGTIADIDLRGKVLLEDSNGDTYPSLGNPVVLSEHHNMYLLVFPLVDNYGKSIFAPDRGAFRLIVRDVGKAAERHFEWKLPVIEANPVRNVANTLMLILGVVGALMVILSPCAIELTTYYTGIIAGIVSSEAGAAKQTRMPIALRARILRNLGAFVAGFTVLYMASGATVALLGQQLMEMQKTVAAPPSADPVCSEEEAGEATPAAGHVHGPGFGSWTTYANWLGASFLVFFALKSLGVLKPGARCFVWLAHLGRKIRMGMASVVGIFSPARAAIIRAPAFSLRNGASITPANSFCAGLGLSVSCLTCMGGAILYPMLIFVGTSTWYWGALILGTFSFALALPMAAIALGVGHYAWQFVHRPWLTRGLQWTSGVVMIGVAILIVFDQTRAINAVIFTVLSAIGGNPGGVVATL